MGFHGNGDGTSQMSFSGAAGSAVIHLITTGNRIDLDTDNDTSIRASADDVMQFETAGTDQMTIAADGGITFANLLAAAASTDVNINGSNELHSVTSSAMYKDQIEDGLDSSRIMGLQPRMFTWRDPIDAPDGWAQHTGDVGRRDFGLIAEEVDRVMPELVNYKDGKPYSVRYQMLSVMLLQELQKIKKEQMN
jgi:hypothetical protein